MFKFWIMELLAQPLVEKIFAFHYLQLFSDEIDHTVGAQQCCALTTDVVQIHENYCNACLRLANIKRQNKSIIQNKLTFQVT